MKINWGTGIVIAFGLFMTFILYFVFKVQSDSKYDNELVVEEYYKQEIGFQKEIDKKQNAQNLAEKVNAISLQIQSAEIPNQGVFFDGQVFDAFALASKIIRSAQKSIVLIDNYILIEC